MACFWVAFLLGHLTLAALILLLQTDVSLIIAIGAGADLISRIFLAISSTCLNIKARYVYLAGALFTIVARFGNYLKSIHHPGRVLHHKIHRNPSWRQTYPGKLAWPYPP